MAHYTQQVSNALNGVRIQNALGTERGKLNCVPGALPSSPRACKVPDMRMRVSDLRKMQEAGFLPPPVPGSIPEGRVSGMNVKRVEHGKTSTWLLLGVGAEPTPQQSLADQDEVNGQSALPASVRTCHANPRALDLIRWLQADKDPRFQMKTSPVLQGPKLPALEGTVIFLAVRSNSQRFADGVQKLVDQIRSTACEKIPVVLLDFPVPGGRVNPKGVVKRSTNVEITITPAQVDEARNRAYRLIADIPAMLSKAGAKAPVSPIPGNLDGKAFVDFHTRWAQGVVDPESRANIIDHIKQYDLANKAYSKLALDQFQQQADLINARMRENAASSEVTLVPLSDLLMPNLKHDDRASWIQLRERFQFERKSD